MWPFHGTRVGRIAGLAVSAVPNRARRNEWIAPASIVDVIRVAEGVRCPY